MAKAATIDEYIASYPPEVQSKLAAVRQAIRGAVPGATETISYGMPAITVDGVPIVYFAGWKRHISMYPIPATDAALAEQLAPHLASKGTLRFPLAGTLPVNLIERVAALLFEQRAERRPGPP